MEFFAVFVGEFLAGSKALGGFCRSALMVSMPLFKSNIGLNPSTVAAFRLLKIAWLAKPRAECSARGKMIPAPVNLRMARLAIDGRSHFLPYSTASSTVIETVAVRPRILSSSEK